MSKSIFEFKGYSIKNLVYSKIPIEGIEATSPDEDISFDSTHGFTEDFSKGKLSLKVQLASEEEDTFLILEVDGFFEINEGLLKDEDGNDRAVGEINQIFVVNGIAILYPYLRSIVSMISGLDDSNRIILPTLNLRNFSIED